ncbi:MAG TPA: amidohydrolase family protein [Anaerolineaceae bacterium]|jgi:carbamoyl-phosphate synthase/aspartate carbamoyltransferase/dihydroorotase|nr:amidohydrolase family protein [Anaerolineaceae bacterium]HQJ02958.1 amidohydrolase family protein [Anaerolineaceae bacterium]
MIKLPGLIDPHVHMRQPGAEHKEDWDSGTAAALAGGFTTVLAMPNTKPPVTDAATLHLASGLASRHARCDYALFLGAGPDNAAEAAALAPRTAGLKLYLDQTYGPLRLDDMTLWAPHFQQFRGGGPLAIHAEGRTMAAAILFAALYGTPVHICHVATREEILLIRKAKEQGLPVTCEVAPHHLFLSTADLPRIGTGRGEVRPRLASPADVQALWDNLDVIDCFATDHAPHTLAEKDSPTPPPGFPGLETCLPLLLTAVHEGRLALEDIVLRCHTNPRRIFHLPEQPDTWVEVDEDAAGTIHAAGAHTRCGWTPFEGMPVRGRVVRVVLRGKTACEDGRVIAPPGSGLDCRSLPPTGIPDAPASFANPD